jgi:hypothetical protein
VSGYVIVDGHKIPVTEIRLTGGKMKLTCEVAGPLPSYTGNGPVTVFGEDDVGVCQGYCFMTWAEVRARDLLTVRVWMAVESCYGDSEVPAVSG